MQTTYNLEMDPAFEGMLAGTGAKQTDSKLLEGAATVRYGHAVIRGSADLDRGALPVTDAAQPLLGVTQHSHFNEVGADDQNLVDPGKMFNCLSEGRIYVQVEDAVTPASPVFCRVTAAAAPMDSVGRFSGAAGAGRRATTGMRFISSAAAEGFAILEIDKGAALA